MYQHLPAVAYHMEARTRGVFQNSNSEKVKDRFSWSWSQRIISWGLADDEGWLCYRSLIPILKYLQINKKPLPKISQLLFSSTINHYLRRSKSSHSKLFFKVAIRNSVKNLKNLLNIPENLPEENEILLK